MENYVAYIKSTKSGKFRGVIGTLHDVGEPDGDRVVQEAFSSDLYEKLKDVVVDMKQQCSQNGITKISTTPIKKGQILFESQLIFE